MAVDRAHRQRFVAGFREPGTDTSKAGARAVRPKGFAAFGCNEQHRGDLLQFDDHIVGIAAVNIGKRIIARGAALPVGRIEQENLLPVMRAESRARVIILALHIEDDDRALPRQQIGNDDAGAFARAGRRFDKDMLATAEGQEAPALAPDDDA